jgi:hypothetical protein
VLPAGITAPLAESFEGGRQLVDSLWRVTSTVPTSTRRWKLVGFPPGLTTDGDTALVLNNANIAAGTINTLYSPSFDTRTIATSPVPTLTFDMSYAKRTSASADELKISFSADCGRTWSVRKNYTATTLPTTTLLQPTWIPTTASQWRSESVPLNGQFFNQASVMVKFEGTTAANGNNLYIDNIRLNGTPLGVAGELAAAGVALAPNPLTAETSLSFNLDRATLVGVRVNDVLGRPVFAEAARAYVPGHHELPLAERLRGAAAGVYVVTVELDGRTYSQKLLVQ